MTQPAGDAVDQFLESHYRLNPVDATFAGVHTHDHRLPDWSPPGLQDAAAELRALRDTLYRPPGAADGPRRPIDAGEVDRTLADASLEIKLAEMSSPHFRRGNPSLWSGEAVFGVIGLLTRDIATLGERAHVAAARMDGIPAFLARAQETIRDAPAEWTARALRECEGADLLFSAGVDRWLASERSIGAASARRAAPRARAAFADFAAWLRSLPAAPEARYACGTRMLELLVHRGHWCARPLADLLAEARDRFAATKDKFEEMARDAAPGGWPEVRERLASRHPEPDHYLSAYERTWTACRALAIARDLVTWPDEWPIRYVPIPVATRDAAPYLYYLSYRSPAPLDPPPVHDYVVQPLDLSLTVEATEQFLRAHNDSVIKLNHVVHHGAIGHHVQNYHAARATSRIGRIAAVDGASRISLFCGGSLAEGWACYATDLMEEAGFLSDEERVAQQHTRLRLLARAIVDLALHSGTMSLDASVAFYAEKVGMEAVAARAEAVKNSMFPGTALMYWLGTQGIHELRSVCAARTAAEGGTFSLRAFHDELLSYGAIPVPMIASLMTQGRLS